MLKYKTIWTLFITMIYIGVHAQENTIKTGLTDAVLGHFNLNYERVINEKQSLAIKVGYWKPTVSPLITEDLLTPSAYTMQDEKGGILASMEYRFYMGRNKAPQGLYIAPYLRYINQAAMYTDEIDANLFNVDTHLNTLGVGAQIGYQVIIGDAFTLDFFFFGAGVDHYNTKLVYTLQQPQSGFDYSTITDDVSAVFEDINYLHSRLKNKVNTDNLTTKLPFLFPGFRMGISMGVAF